MSVRTQRLKELKLNKIYLPKVKKARLWLFIGGMFFLSVWLFLGEALGATAPADYALNLDVAVTNTTTEDLDMLVPVSIDSSLLSNFDLVNAGFSDILFADLSDVVTKGLVQDISSASSTWFMISTAPAGEMQIEQLYLTGPEAIQGFPVQLPNQTKLEALNSSTLQIEDDLSVAITVDTVTCGTIFSKHNTLFGDDATGWGVWAIGNEDIANAIDSTFSFFDDEQYYDITPINDLLLCGVSLGKTGLVLVTRVQIENQTTSLEVLDTTITYYPEFTGITQGSMGLLETPVLLTGGTTYRVYVTYSGANVTTALDLDITTSIARYQHADTSVSFDSKTWSQMLFDVDGDTITDSVNQPGILFMAPDITASTSTVLDITNSTIVDASVNCGSLKGSGNIMRWKGNEVTFQLDYSTGTGDLSLSANGFPVTMTLPSCEIFGNKLGNQSGMSAISSWALPSNDQLVTSLFTLSASSTVSNINVPIGYDRNGDTRSGISMSYTSRAALYDSSRNFIASPAAKVLTIDSTSETQEILTFEFILPIPLGPGDYYLAYWAGDPEQTIPITSTGFEGNVDGLNELLVSDIDGASDVAQAIYDCPWYSLPTRIGSDHWITVESVRVYVDSVVGTRKLRAALYTTSFSPPGLELFERETNEVTVVQGWNTLTFSPPFVWQPYKNPSPYYQARIAFWTDETLHDVPFSLAYDTDVYHGFEPLEVLPCAQRVSGTYPTWPDPLPVSTGRPHIGAGVPVGQFILYEVTYGDIINLGIRANSKTSSTNTVEVDDVNYTGSWPNPFINDSPYANQELAIWGDLQPITPSLIATSTTPFLSGAGLTGKIDDLSVSGDGSLVLFSPFNPTNNSLTQVGNSGNDWTWLGQIQDGSMQNNDLTYTIVSDQTGVSSVLIPLEANATPLVFTAAELPDIVGDPELAVFTTPGELTPSVIMDKLRNVSSNGDFPATMFWLILGSFVLVAFSSVSMRVMSYDMVPWGISIVGFFLISVIAGPDFLILWVALNGLYVTGVLLIMNFSR